MLSHQKERLVEKESKSALICQGKRNSLQTTGKGYFFSADYQKPVYHSFIITHVKPAYMPLINNRILSNNHPIFSNYLLFCWVQIASRQPGEKIFTPNFQQTLERLRQSVKKINRALRLNKNETAKRDSSGNKDGLLQSSKEEGRSNPVWEDWIQVPASTKQSENQIEPSERRYMDDRVMGESAKTLSPEQMAALEIDIFKPLDFYEILFNRLKVSDKGRIINNINQLWMLQVFHCKITADTYAATSFVYAQ